MTVLHVEPTEHSELLHADWEHYVEQSLRAASKEPPKVQVLPSPYRFVIIPIVQFILDLSKEHPARSIVVVIPELVEDKWYEYFLHNQRGRLLEWVLLARGNERIFTVSAPLVRRGANLAISGDGYDVYKILDGCCAGNQPQLAEF